MAQPGWTSCECRQELRRAVEVQASMNVFAFVNKVIPYCLLAVGVVGILLSCWMMIPVAVNLPDSWFGGLLAVLLFSGGVACLAMGFRHVLRGE